MEVLRTGKCICDENSEQDLSRSQGGLDQNLHHAEHTDQDPRRSPPKIVELYLLGTL